MTWTTSTCRITTGEVSTLLIRLVKFAAFYDGFEAKMDLLCPKAAMYC